MSLLWRLLWTTLAALLDRRRLGAAAESRLAFRVWPTDLDLNLHMTNARYLSIMDLGRLDLIVRTGIGRRMIREKWAAILGEAQIRFRRPLAPFQPFELATRVVRWDEKWIYLEQRIESRGELCAVAMMKGIFRSRAGAVAPEQVLADLIPRLSAVTTPTADAVTTPTADAAMTPTADAATTQTADTTADRDHFPSFTPQGVQP